jgi:hypothetical protein
LGFSPFGITPKRLERESQRTLIDVKAFLELSNDVQWKAVLNTYANVLDGF